MAMSVTHKTIKKSPTIIKQQQMRRGSPNRSHWDYEILGLLNTTKVDKNGAKGAINTTHKTTTS